MSTVKFSKKGYYYNEDQDIYVFFIKDRPVEIEGEDLKGMKRAYSNWDDNPFTIAEVSREFEIPKPVFTAIKNELGWVHDSDPYLDEEIESEEIEDLADEVINKRNELANKFQKEKQKDLVKKAEKYDELQHKAVEPIIEAVNERVGEYKPFNVNMRGVNNASDLYFVFCPTDLHVNKLPYNLESFSQEKYEDEVLSATGNILQDAFKFGKPKEIISIIGSDLFHVDNTDHATSAGTGQDGQVYGSYYDVLTSGYELMYQIADLTVSTGIKNDFYTIEGNHDRVLSLGMGQALAQRYRNEPNFEINNDRESRKYRKIGQYLVGMTHGEYLKRNQTTRNREIQGRIIQDARKKGINTGNIINYYMLSGHTHKSSANHEEDTGVWDIVCPSLSVTDWWHHLHNFEGNTRAVAGYLISPDTGLKSIIYENTNLNE